MREIKFRAWDKGKKEMETFNLYDISYDYDNGYWLKGAGASLNFDVLKDTEIMQFTGLLDKNGKEIYEGDIVEFSSFEEGREREEISWAKHFTGFCFSKEDADRYEIIGNIYENPELLSPKD